MPKATTPSFPLNGLFAINKPSGPTSMKLLDSLKPLFADSTLFKDPKATQANSSKKRKGGPVKIGQGGTLDPLADGVLVIGLNNGTKKLQQFLDCSKEYRTTALLGCSTDTFDSQGSIVSYAPYSHLSPSAIESVLSRFRGEILQYPPIYSALKMDGKPLYEYARNGEKLPRPIEPRKVIVHELVLESWQEGKKEGAGEEDKGHGFRWPEKKMTQEERELADTAARLVREAEAAESQASSASLEAPASSTAESHVVPPTSQSSPPQPDDFSAPTSTPPAFTLRMTVSSGTYVRSIVHDIALALNSAAHVVVLQRTRQGEFSLPDASTGAGGDCVSWDLFQQAVDERQEERKAAGLWGGEKGKGSQKKIAAQKVVDVEEDEEMMGNDETPVEVAKPAGDGLKAWELALLSKFRPS